VSLNYKLYYSNRCNIKAMEDIDIVVFHNYLRTSRAIHDADEVPTALPLLEKEVAVEIATEVTLSSDEIASTPREVYESKKNQTALISEEETTTVSSLENY